MKGIIRKTHKIDATGQVPGRLATRIARLLIGKHKVAYLPHLDIGDMVEVENIDGLVISKKKLTDKIYYQHSLYPGGMKTKQAKDLKPADILRRAVKKMLPKNRLQAKMIKRLTIQ